MQENATVTLEPIKILFALLSKGRFSCATESKAQADMEAHLLVSGVSFEREKRLGAAGRVDFYLPRSGLAIELKDARSHSKREVFRQCERYCLEESVSGLILATGRMQGLPATIHGKPVMVLQLGLAFL